MSQQLMGYGGHVADTDEALQSKIGGKFGLNSNVRVSKIAYNPNVAKEGQPVREGIELVVLIEAKEFKDWISPVTKVYGANNAELALTNPPTDEYVKNYNAAVIQQKAVMTHYLKALGVPEENIKNTANSATSFTDWAQKMAALAPADYASRPVDVFLEYQNSISDGQNRTWPTLPKNMKGGYFIIPAVPGTYKEVLSEEGLKYVNEAGAEHPFNRSKNFMDSNKAKLQEKGGSSTPAAGANPMTPGNGSAKVETWT